ncbi:hypothetical protein F4780DRAFT_737582 [Xylariomycetidae sp. FL0641]|nr:hypothetical protein F4780DRAFT_737582 [Xylariomycetidae sp. FL0641]
MPSLEEICGELGISQYLGAFIDQGFDSWDTILDITESDLDALGVKLGHRRKLQRRIANYRGLAPDASLVSPTRTSIEEPRSESSRAAEPSRVENKDGTTVAKRKYRRHPKPDENAPERPPSAYVLFSNKMREDLKGQNLTFTEIAKLVGENWQNLNRSEKEPFEKQAQEAKERYNRDLAEYKRTPEYKKYTEYLQDFRKRQALHCQEKDAAKRLKIDADGTRGSSTRTLGSGSDSQPGSEPPPSRQQRMGSAISIPDAYPLGADDASRSPRTRSLDGALVNRARGSSDTNSRAAPGYPSNRRTIWPDHQRMSGEPGAGPPWLDPRSAGSSMARSPESSGLPGLTTMPSQGSATSSISRPPSLSTEQSSSGSISSLNSVNVPRTPSDASLPIHALLSSKPEPPQYVSPTGQPPTATSSLPPPILQPQSAQPPSEYFAKGHQVHGNGFVPVPQLSEVPGRTPDVSREPSMFSPSAEHGLSPVAKREGVRDGGLDGISALLRAREIVDRR